MTKKTVTITPAQKAAKEASLLKRRKALEAHEANVLALQKNQDLWAAFTSLRNSIASLNGDKKVAVRTLKKLLNVSTKTVNREKLLRRAEALNARIAKIQAQLGEASAE